MHHVTVMTLTNLAFGRVDWAFRILLYILLVAVVVLLPLLYLLYLFLHGLL